MNLRSSLVSLILTAAFAWSLPVIGAELEVPAKYATIQLAVNAAASGDTIHIAPGIYQEQVIIDQKNLTLSGAPGTVLRAFPGMSQDVNAFFRDPPPTTKYLPLLGVNLAKVVITGLELEGEYLATMYFPDHLQGIALMSASARIEHCRLRGFRGIASQGGSLYDNGAGLFAVSQAFPSRPVVDVAVFDCEFADNGTGLQMLGDSADPALRLRFSVSTSVFSGSKHTDATSENGIVLGIGAGGAIVRNTVRDFIAGADGSIGVGIFAFDSLDFFRGKPLAALQPIRYEGNQFFGNQLALASAAGHGAVFANNMFQGFATGPSGIGLSTSGDSDEITGNRFADLETGVVLFGNDPNYGTAFGIASNPHLAGNRFCRVTTPVNKEPLVTGVRENGSLTCPFPPPLLSVAPSVLLAWPDYTEGWLLESAASTEGPWTLVDGAATLQDDHNTVAVKSDSTHQFFRLRKP